MWVLTCVLLYAHVYTHYSRARCRTEQWWIGSHRPLVCSFSESSRWLRSSQGSKATPGSQRYPSLWSRDLTPPPPTPTHPHPHPLFLWMKTDRKLCFPLRQLLHSPLSDGRCPPVLSARGKIYLCHFNSDLLLMLWWWFHIKFSSETDHYLVAANLDPVGMFLFKACSNTRLLNLTFTAMKTQCWALTVCTILKIKRPFCI